MNALTNGLDIFFFKGKEIIEYYLRQLEEEGIKFIPRWIPPVTFKSEHSKSRSGCLLSSPVNIPEAAINEELITKDINACNNALDPTAGTPDGALFACPNLFCGCSLSSPDFYRQ